MKARILLAALLVAPLLPVVTTAPAAAAPAPAFVTRSGSQLTVSGKPFR